MVSTEAAQAGYLWQGSMRNPFLLMAAILPSALALPGCLRADLKQQMCAGLLLHPPASATVFFKLPTCPTVMPGCGSSASRSGRGLTPVPTAAMLPCSARGRWRWWWIRHSAWARPRRACGPAACWNPSGRPGPPTSSLAEPCDQSPVACAGLHGPPSGQMRTAALAPRQ